MRLSLFFVSYFYILYVVCSLFSTLSFSVLTPEHEKKINSIYRKQYISAKQSLIAYCRHRMLFGNYKVDIFIG